MRINYRNPLDPKAPRGYYIATPVQGQRPKGSLQNAPVRYSDVMDSVYKNQPSYYKEQTKQYRDKYGALSEEADIYKSGESHELYANKKDIPKLNKLEGYLHDILYTVPNKNIHKIKYIPIGFIGNNKFMTNKLKKYTVDGMVHIDKAIQEDPNLKNRYEYYIKDYCRLMLFINNPMLLQQIGLLYKEMSSLLVSNYFITWDVKHLKDHMEQLTYKNFPDVPKEHIDKVKMLLNKTIKYIKEINESKKAIEKKVGDAWEVGKIYKVTM